MTKGYKTFKAGTECTLKEPVCCPKDGGEFIIETGLKLNEAVNTLNRLLIKCEIIGLITLFDNDASIKKSFKIKKEFINEGKLFCLFKSSQLLADSLSDIH